MSPLPITLPLELPACRRRQPPRRPGPKAARPPLPLGRPRLRLSPPTRRHARRQPGNPHGSLPRPDQRPGARGRPRLYRRRANARLRRPRPRRPNAPVLPHCHQSPNGRGHCPRGLPQIGLLPRHGNPWNGPARHRYRLRQVRRRASSRRTSRARSDPRGTLPSATLPAAWCRDRAPPRRLGTRSSTPLATVAWVSSTRPISPRSSAMLP